MNAVAFNTVLSDYISNIVVLIMDKYGYDEKTAMYKFFFSKTYLMLADEQMGMFEFGEEGILDIWEAEQITGNPRNSVYIRGE